jgi:hypothetical protein
MQKNGAEVIMKSKKIFCHCEPPTGGVAISLQKGRKYDFSPGDCHSRSTPSQ